MNREMLLSVALVAVAWAAPALLLLTGLLRHRSRRGTRRWDWQVVVVSTLFCTAAFNLTFLLQEFFLVLPKAFVPGLKPVLYHNDHSWAGTAPVAELFEGTGAVAIVAMALAFSIAAKGKNRSWARLFALWMAFEGLFQGLPQFVLGAMLPGNDVGRAYAYLHIGGVGRSLLACLALLAVPATGIWIGRYALSFADSAAAVEDWRARTRTIAEILALPALGAIPLIIPFRVPREAVEVVLLPLLVQLMGAGWVLAAAWPRGTPSVHGLSSSRPVIGAAVLVAGLLAVFQLVLRPGIRFY